MPIMPSEFEVRIVRNDLPLKKRLLPSEMGRRLDSLSEEGVNIVKVAMQTSPADGNVYPRGGGKSHVASSPGNAPRIDTGRLINSLRWEPRGRDERLIIAGTEYAAYQEFGTDDIAPRPFMGPMAQQLRGMVAGKFDRFLEDK